MMPTVSSLKYAWKNAEGLYAHTNGGGGCGWGPIEDAALFYSHILWPSFLDPKTQGLHPVPVHCVETRAEARTQHTKPSTLLESELTGRNVVLSPINLYAGFDASEEVGFHTFISSIIHQTTIPIGITPIGAALFSSHGMQKRADESTNFARVRFLIPWIQGFRGWALFCDGSDMIVRADIAELWALRHPYMAVQVVKHDYKTRHPRKYVGTQMEAENRDYLMKNASSVMLINCSHFSWRDLTPEVVQKMSGEDLHQFKHIKDELIGALPIEWNWLVDEFGENQEAKLLHWTAGIPAFPRYASAPMADEWAQAALRVTHVTI